MEKVTMYKCSSCGKIFEDENSCASHEEKSCLKLSRWHFINDKWENGCTLGEINDEFHIISKLPAEIRSATKTTVLRCAATQYRKEAVGTIQKFVCSHMVFVSYGSLWKRTWHLRYAEGKLMENFMEDK